MCGGLMAGIHLLAAGVDKLVTDQVGRLSLR